MSKLKVMTILGTRPEIIRLSRVMARLDQFTEHYIVHTGQNYDYELNEVFFENLGIRNPDVFLGVAGKSLGETLGKILVESEKVLIKYKPDAVLILGDTNSSISAIIARRLKIPIYHMEAGNRSFDMNVPEETNRKIVDHISDFNLVYTEHARRHLLTEGIEHRRINLTGSPMREVLEYYREAIESSDILNKLNLVKRNYFTVSLHREENVDNKNRLSSLIAALNSVAENYNLPVIVSTHPRTQNKLKELNIETHNNIRFLKPFGFHDYNHLQKYSKCVISDSGTIAEEASILEFPAITPRDAIERPEGLDTGCLIMTGLDSDTILNCIDAISQQFLNRETAKQEHAVPQDYCILNTSERVLNLILGTAKLSNQRNGIRKND